MYLGQYWFSSDRWQPSGSVAISRIIILCAWKCVCVYGQRSYIQEQCNEMALLGIQNSELIEILMSIK